MLSDLSQYAWVVPLFPLVAFLMLTSIGRQAKRLGVYISLTASTASFLLAVVIFISRVGKDATDYTWDRFKWLDFGEFTLRMGFEMNNLNALMLLIVSTITLLVLIYSCGYMRDDERTNVYHGYISLFSFSMLELVLSINLIQLYIFWELVGACSFLLIGFWYFKPEAKAAARKAFIVTRIGDIGLFVAILLLYRNMPDHQLTFNAIRNEFTNGSAMSAGLIALIAILIFVGAMGKSGQFPLHTWLPDAMEGPTPISALIHAATMVAAGVYLVARTYPIFMVSHTALIVVASVGAFTAIFAAIIGTTQNDIKRVLAYSTISQLGYMMMALGLGTWAAYSAGVFHLFTHAFFKALLFLAAGSVIHAVHTQNIHEMGGVGRGMKITAWTFGIGALSLSGIFPFSGFWSKDAILTEAYHENLPLFWVGLLAAFFTAFYMARVFFLVFTGESRNKSADHVPHESPRSMTLPLIVLAVPAAIVGFILIPGVNPWFGDWITGQTLELSAEWPVILLSTLVGLLGIGLGYVVYVKNSISREIIISGAPWLYTLVERKFFVDEAYQKAIVGPLKGLGYLLELFDHYVVDGMVRLVAWISVQLSRLVERLQNGQVQTYGLVTLLGLVLLVLAVAGRRFLHVG
ncbi:MAG: NADH-quinone oxidoreductase subunit L [Gorillibacterium sp.]|nr:NADH-quinone oxidoreductase subunit L [Gorillibacterium sp.]